MSKTILITGSSGQIGSSIVKLFLDLGSKVYGFDKTKNTIKHNNYRHKTNESNYSTLE